jgi:NAD+ synthase
MFDAVKVKNDCVQWIRDWFEKNGPGCNAIVGISGGKDSSVVAALCVEALGKDRVIGVLMPNGIQNDINDAFALVKHLDIKHTVININRVYKDILNSLFYCSHLGNMGRHIIPTNQAVTNLPPRIRMTVLYAVSQSLNGRVACTDNLSESYVGYSTRWGDNIGDFSPIVNYTASEVIAIGDALGLPQDLVHKTPSDGLCGKTDEDNFGFTYEQLDSFIRTGYSGDEEVDKLIWDKHTKNYFKAVYLPHPYAQLDVHGWV